MAERVGFEPTVELPRRMLSKHVDSATLAPLRVQTIREARILAWPGRGRLPVCMPSHGLDVIYSVCSAHWREYSAGHLLEKPSGRRGAEMSILVVEVLSEGLIFGADRNITAMPKGGEPTQVKKQPKVLKWPKKNILFGFVGAARVGGTPMHQWLNSIKREFRALTTIEEIAQSLKNKVQEQRSRDEANGSAEPLIIHLGGFEKRDGYWAPVVWYIRNVYKYGRFGYLDFRKEFECSETFWPYFKDVDPSEIRKDLKVRAKQLNPFWFHQGIDLITFNVLQASIKSSFKLLCEQHPDHDIPTTLEEWVKHVRMQVLMYGAYYEAFHPKGRRYVGGGADVEFIPWP
jgi:hypothetical protein